jgi:hypothetical protein
MLTALTTLLLIHEIHTVHKEINAVNITMPLTDRLTHIAISCCHVLLAICYAIILAVLLCILVRVAEEIGKT